jgi:hypothetical protein
MTLVPIYAFAHPIILKQRSRAAGNITLRDSKKINFLLI